MKKIKIFAEIGFGNISFCSTEIETKRFEHRVKKFIIPPKIDGVYLRVWIGTRVYAISSNRLFNTTKKDRTNFKFIFGIEGSR